MQSFLLSRDSIHPHVFPHREGFEIRNFTPSFYLGLRRTKAIAIHCIAILLFSPTLLCVNSTEIPFVSDHLARTDNG